MTESIRLLTLNVFLRPPPIKTNDDDYKEERFQEILKIIDNYDIVCFQEMFQTATFRPERIIQAAIKKSISSYNHKSSIIGKSVSLPLLDQDPWSIQDLWFYRNTPSSLVNFRAIILEFCLIVLQIRGTSTVR